MPYIIEEIPWTSQPQSPVPIDRDNPLSAGFTSFLYPAGGKFFDACDSALRSGVTTAITDSVSKYGKNLEFNGTSSGINFGDVETVNFAGAYSIFVLFRPDAQTGARREILVAKDAAAGRQFTVELNPSGTSGSGNGQTASIGHTRFINNTSYYQKYSAANVVTNGQWYSLLIGSTDGSSDIVAYLNGVALSLNNSSSLVTGLIQNTTTPLIIGSRNYVGAEDYFYGGIAAVGIANVAPNAVLAMELYRNPYQLLQKQERKTYYDLIGSNLNLSINKVASSNIVDYPIIELNPSFNKLNQASAVRSLTVNSNIIANVSNTSIGNRNLSILSLLNSNINNPSILVNNLNININFNINLISRSSILSTLLSESMSTLIIGTSGINSLLAITLNNQISIANNSIRNFNQSINNNIGLNIRNNSSINSIQSILNDLRLNNSNNSDIIAALSELGLLQDLFLTTLLSNNSNPSFNLAYYSLLKNLRIKQVVILNSAKSIVTVETIKAIVKLVRSS